MPLFTLCLPHVHLPMCTLEKGTKFHLYKTITCLENALSVFRNDSRVCDYKSKLLLTLKSATNK